MAVVTIKPTAVSGATNYFSSGPGDHVVVTTDGNDGTYTSPQSAGDSILFDCEDPSGDASAPVTLVLIRARSSSSDGNGTFKHRIKLGGTTVEGPQVSVGASAAWYEWSATRPNGGAFTLADVRDAAYGVGSTNWIAGPPFLIEFEVQVTYERVPGQSESVRDCAGRRLVSGNKVRTHASLPVHLGLGLDVELLDPVSITHYAGPDVNRTTTSRRTGWGRERWERGLLRLMRRQLDTDGYLVNWTLKDVRDTLYTYRNSGRSTRAATDLKEGVLILTSGGAHTAARSSLAWTEGAGDRRYYQASVDFARYETSGLRVESGRSNLLTRSAAVSGLTGLTTGGTGVNGSAITAETLAGTDPALWDSVLTTRCYKFAAGNPHASDLTLAWAATASQAANTKVRLSVYHRDDAGAVLSWRLVRNVDGRYWNDAAGTWDVGVVTNTFTVRTGTTVADNADLSKVVDVGGGATTLTLTLLQATGGTASRVNRVYGVQLEDGAWATSPVLTDAAAVTRAAETMRVQNDVGKRSVHNPRWSFRSKLRPLFDAADVSGVNLALWSARHDAANRWVLYYDGTAQQLKLECVASGATTTATASWVPVRGTTYRLGARATSAEGELLLASRTCSVFVDGTKGTDAARASDPVEVDDADLYLGSDTVHAACNGHLSDVHFVQLVLSDMEMAASSW